VSSGADIERVRRRCFSMSQHLILPLMQLQEYSVSPDGDAYDRAMCLALPYSKNLRAERAPYRHFLRGCLSICWVSYVDRRAARRLPAFSQKVI